MPRSGSPEVRAICSPLREVKPIKTPERDNFLGGLAFTILICNGYVRAPPCHVRTELAVSIAYEPWRPLGRIPPCGAPTFAQQIIALRELLLASLDRVQSG